MKLYFYQEFRKFIDFTEVEVKETPKMYKAIKGYLPGYRSSVCKDEIGDLLNPEYSNPYVFYTEPNEAAARELFRQNRIRQVEELRKNIQSEEERIEAIQTIPVRVNAD